MRVAKTLAIVVPALVIACGGSSEKTDEARGNDAPGPAEVERTEDRAATTDLPSATSTTAESTTTGTEAPPDTDAAPIDATDDGAEPPSPPTFVGPCSVRWSNGANLQLAYEARSAAVRLDENDDGKTDHCARIELDGARIASLEMDPGCSGKSKYTLSPTYDAETNIAVADYTEREGGKSRSRSITIVTLPSFVGLEPGYTLYAKRSSIKFVMRQGRVHSARVRKPFIGPALEAKFTYDDAGRIKTIAEDFESDGSVDRKLDYGYDERGRITRMEVTYGPQAIPEKNSARLDYGCWDDAATAKP